jgi:hypothetical protein
MDPWCRGVWRSSWRSAVGTLTSQRRHGVVSGHPIRHSGKGWLAGSDRQYAHVRQHERTQVTRSLPMGERRHPVLCTCSRHGWLPCCRAVTDGAR